VGDLVAAQARSSDYLTSIVDRICLTECATQRAQICDRVLYLSRQVSGDREYCEQRHCADASQL
jgi:hypothetical protein